jgi:sarcosine oxidase subunit alpha
MSGGGSSNPMRVADLGRIDRTRALSFTFNGTRHSGFEGDTLASALLANGVQLVGRSARYHRRRGIFAAGAEEPNALVQLETGARTEPNLRATQVLLYDGLVASSQNGWPSVGFDIGVIRANLSRMLPAGFRHKTFMWPAPGWKACEWFIRRAAGLGRAPKLPDPDRYAHRHAHCDVLVCGGGPAGLAAALAAARGGARVILADEGSEVGGSLLGERAQINRNEAARWVHEVATELKSTPGVRMLVRSQVSAIWDHGMATVVEQVGSGAPVVAHPPAAHLPRQRLWKIRAREIVIATGAIERSIAFGNNDLPGVMLAGSARTYLNRHGVQPGRRAVVFTNNDSAYHAALDLHRSGVAISAIIDLRHEPSGSAFDAAVAAGIKVHAGHGVLRTLGGTSVRAALVAPVDAEGRAASDARGTAFPVEGDTLLVSGGWNPAVELWSQARGQLKFDEALATFVPDPANRAPAHIRCAGSAAGAFQLADCVVQGLAAGRAAASDAGLGRSPTMFPPMIERETACPLLPVWQVDYPEASRYKRFIDLQGDVTVADVADADDAIETPIAQVGADAFRPPCTPVTLGAIAGPETGNAVDPLRRTAIDGWHAANGAEFVNSGLWRRPRFYRQACESELDAVNREVRAVRNGVGLFDIGTLGKIDLQGRDCAAFLQRVYINDPATLAIGRCQHGVMLREDGMVFDDGVVTRLGDTHYLMTTTTANAEAVLSRLEYLLQVEWPDLDVYLTCVTEHWAAMALAGPRSRAVLEKVADIDVSDAGLPCMAYRACRVAGVEARVCRISFSGERSYEVYVPSGHGRAVWEALMDAGAAQGLVACGTEAMGVMRIEKGRFVVGSEADGRTTPGDLGLHRMIRKEGDFIGRRSLSRPGLTAEDRPHLVGLVPVHAREPIPRGSMLVVEPRQVTPYPMEGFVASSCFSPTIGCAIALALVSRGHLRKGQRLWAMSPLMRMSIEVEVVDPIFVDPAGDRLRG